MTCKDRFTYETIGNKAMWTANAALAELLALSLRHPNRELCEAITEGEWLDAAYEVTGALGVECPLPEGSDELTVGKDGSSCLDADTLLHELRAEATRLFVGAPLPATSPYEAIWRAEEEGAKGLLFVNPHSQDVERFMRSCGLGRPEGTNEPLDHVATELELMSYLAQLAGGADPLEAATPAEKLPGGSAAAAFRQFVSEHFLTWAPQFAAALAEHTRLPFYRMLAGLLSAYCASL